MSANAVHVHVQHVSCVCACMLVACWSGAPSHIKIEPRIMYLAVSRARSTRRLKMHACTSQPPLDARRGENNTWRRGAHRSLRGWPMSSTHSVARPRARGARPSPPEWAALPRRERARPGCRLRACVASTRGSISSAAAAERRSWARESECARACRRECTAQGVVFVSVCAVLRRLRAVASSTSSGSTSTSCLCLSLSHSHCLSVWETAREPTRLRAGGESN